MTATLAEVELCFPQLLNSSCEKAVRSHVVSMVTSIVLAAIGIITVLFNLLVIISISHFRQLHTPTNFLLLSLAISDFCVGLLFFFQILLLESCWFLGDILCCVYFLLDYIVTSSSITVMVLISVDRYVAICDPMQYPFRVTENRVKVCICACWVCSVLYDVVLLRDNLIHPGMYNSCHGECVVGTDAASGVVDMVLTFICPVSVMVVLYTRVFVVAVTQARAMRVQVVSLSVAKGAGKAMAKKSEMKAARTLGIVMVVFLMCLCPYFCTSPALVEESVLNNSSLSFVLCLFYFNSCLNPIIYAFFYPWFRKCIKVIVTFKILQPGSQDSRVR